MKIQICLTVLFISLISFMNGQNTDIMKREYGYNNAGNRIVRKEVFLPSPPKSPGHKSVSSESDTNFNDFYTDKLGDISLKIYPNPTTSVVKLQIEGIEGEITGMVHLYNLTGSEIGSQPIKSYQMEIDMSSYSTGTYLATVVVNGKTTYWKIVKQ